MSRPNPLRALAEAVAEVARAQAQQAHTWSRLADALGVLAFADEQKALAAQAEDLGREPIETVGPPKSFFLNEQHTTKAPKKRSHKAKPKVTEDDIEAARKRLHRMQKK